jgi:hypothetical protein
MVMASTTTINRLRISGPPAAATTCRLAADSLLNRADFQPPDMPPAAVLIVRRLADPLPGRLRLQPGAQLDRQWEEAARQALARLYRQAARPAHGPVTSAVQAVRFADEAELLACLALDVSLGRAAERWWWQSYRRRWGSLATAVAPTLMLESPRLLPAALRLLAARGQAGAVVRCFSPGQARQAIQTICAAYDITPPDLPLRSAPPAIRDGSVDGPPPSAPPWNRWLAGNGATEDLPLECVCLLGMALALAHAPAVAQSAAFRAAVEGWWQAEHARGRLSPEASQQRGPASAPALSAPEHPQQPATPTGAGASVAPTASGAVQGSIGRDEASPGLPDAGAVPGPRAWDAAPASPRSLPPSPSGAQHAQPAVGAATGGGARHRDVQAGADARAAVTPPADAASSPWPGLEGVATELGGVLFLINIMQRLDLPDCFEADWQLASQVGPWGALELLARGLLSQVSPVAQADDSDALLSDPLWSALAAIDGRQAGELPHGAVTCPAMLRIPAAWLRWLEPGAAMTAPLPAPLEGPLLAGVDRNLRTWVAAVTPLVQQMLRRTLGGEFHAVSGLLLRWGQLYVTSNHVDLVLPLASVSLPVRIAGLDFNPGWLPAFGRVVQFHYQ